MDRRHLDRFGDLPVDREHRGVLALLVAGRGRGLASLWSAVPLGDLPAVEHGMVQRFLGGEIDEDDDRRWADVVFASASSTLRLHGRYGR